MQSDRPSVCTMIYGGVQSEMYSKNWGSTMRFQRVTALANATPTSVLCEVWGESPEYVASRQNSEHPMTVKEAGELAEVHGLKLEGVLGV